MTGTYDRGACDRRYQSSIRNFDGCSMAGTIRAKARLPAKGNKVRSSDLMHDAMTVVPGTTVMYQ